MFIEAVEDKVRGSTPPEKKEECEVMVTRVSEQNVAVCSGKEELASHIGNYTCFLSPNMDVVFSAKFLSVLSKFQVAKLAIFCVVHFSLSGSEIY